MSEDDWRYTNPNLFHPLDLYDLSVLRTPRRSLASNLVGVIGFCVIVGALVLILMATHGDCTFWGSC